MTGLRELQRLVRDAVFEDTADGPALTAASEHIKATENLPPAEHLRIYRSGILGTLARSLAELYPVCSRVLGDAFFEAMAGVYARRVPSRSPDLGEYGADFAEFVAGFEPAAALPYLPDVARLEWRWHRVFHGPESGRLDLDALARVPAERQGAIIFRLPAASALLASAYPVHRIWQVNQPDYEGDEHVDLDEGGVRLLIWRDGYTMRIDTLREGEWCALEATQGGDSFETVCARLENVEPRLDMAQLLPQLVQRGWIGSFSLPE